MSQPGYQEDSQQIWWWKVAKHLDATQLAAVNAMAHNLDDQSAVLALQDKLREAQVILLEIFRGKGMLPGDPNGPSVSVPEVIPPAPEAHEVVIAHPSPEAPEALEALGEDPPSIATTETSASSEIEA